jgi:hypothetical protein
VSRYDKTKELTHELVMDAQKDLFYRAVKSVVWYPLYNNMYNMAVVSINRMEGMTNMAVVSINRMEGMTNMSVVSFIRNAEVS